MWLFCVGEDLEMALGQEWRRVVGTDPRCRLAEPRNPLQDALWGRFDPSRVSGLVGTTRRDASCGRSCWGRRGPGLGTLLGIVALASAPWSGARLDCAVFRPSAAGSAVRGSLGFQQLSFGDKGLFSQLPSYRCSVRDNNRSRGVGGSPLALS